MSKAQLIEDAFGLLGITDIDQGETQAAMRQLNAMMAAWDAHGVRVGWGDGSDASIPDYAQEAVVSSLACRIAPSKGKQIPPFVQVMAKAGWDTLVLQAARPKSQQLRQLPSGAGGYGRFTSEPEPELLTLTPGGDLGITESTS